MNSVWCFLVVLLMLAGFQVRAFGEGWAFYRSCSSVEKQILSELEVDVSFAFDEAGLQEVLEQVSDAHGFRVVVDQSVDGELDTTVEVSLDVEDVSLRSVLELLLRPIGLTYVVRNDVLFITAPSRATDLRVYNVEPMIRAGIDQTSVAEVVSKLATSSRIASPSQENSSQTQAVSAAAARNGSAWKLAANTKPPRHQAASPVRFLVAKGNLLAVRATDQQHVEVSHALQSIWSASQASRTVQKGSDARTDGRMEEVRKRRVRRPTPTRDEVSPKDDPFGDPFGQAADHQSDTEDPFSDLDGANDDNPFGDLNGESEAQDDPFGDF